ncbi:MAG: UDP-N-acetylmuramate dehydrogenase [Tannerella sp.]|jgi:UDP-N-acetylmuramate dehydrogenase|nr:UDP-N-acetylmuramate dehydrogenase [Tannerella sp.]
MKIEQYYSLEKHNTFRLPVQTRWFVEYESANDLQRILRDEYFREWQSLHIGRGSNLLFLDNWNGVILHSAIRGIEPVDETDAAVWLRVGAGEVWDDVVAHAAGKGWGGIENLSHIPGETGAAAVQNIGAYGVEIKDVVETVEAYGQLTAEKRIFTRKDCLYDYRHSFFKNETHEPYIITHVVLRLAKHPSFTLDYGDLKAQLAEGPSLTPAGVREAVIRIRRRKLPDPSELANAGSFFMNPTVSRSRFDRLKRDWPDIPSYPAKNGMVKLSAGWLIDQCGLKGTRAGHVGTYARQALVIVNYGLATGCEIARFAEQIREQVKARFGVELAAEVKTVGSE